MKQFILVTISSVCLNFALDISASNANNDNKVLGGHEYVDLALPSGTLWAKFNIGAQNEKDPGSFYAWGETKPKDHTKYTQAFYKYNKAETYLNQIKVKKTRYKITKYSNSSSWGVVDNKKELESTDDAAIINWGDFWCMPTEDQLRELICECQWEQIGTNGKTLYKVVGKNDNYIYIPVGGFLRPDNNFGDSPNMSQSQANGSKLNDKNDKANYWSKNLNLMAAGMAITMTVEHRGGSINYSDRSFGANIRPVVSKKGLAEITKLNPVSISKGWLEENDGIFNANDLFPFESRSYYPMYYLENQDKISQEISKIMTLRYPQIKATNEMTMMLLERDNPKTQHLFLLGYCKYVGLGTKVNKDDSYNLFREAAVKGDHRCAVMMFALGLASEKNAEDVKLLSKAASSGYLPAKVAYTFIKASNNPNRYMDSNYYKYFSKDSLGVLLSYNYPEAYYLYGKILSDNTYIEKAAEMGHLYAINDMVQYFDSKQMYEKAYQYIQKGEKIGFQFDNTLQTRVRINRLSLSNDPKDIAKAMKEAYDMGAYQFVVSIGSNAAKRKIASPDIIALHTQASSKSGNIDANQRKILFGFMKKSAEGGSIYGMEGLAEFYEKGYGLDAPDMNNALNWYRQAAQKGSEKAKKYLKNGNLKW